MIKLPTMEQVSRAVNKVGFETKKHSPLILMITGAVSLGATAYTAYKAQTRVSELVNEMEEKRMLEKRYLELKQVGTSRLTQDEVVELYEMDRDNTYVFDRVHYMTQIAAAVAKPVIFGTMALVSFSWSYKILTGRVNSLTATVVSLTADKVNQELRMRRELTEEQYKRVTQQTEPKEVETTDENGDKKIIKGDAKSGTKSLEGIWFSDSSEFVKDDMDYNLHWIDMADRKTEKYLTRRGFLLLNQVYDELGIERTPEGQIMGWDLGDNFSMSIDKVDCIDHSGEMYTELFVRWPMPRPVYADVDFNGRYSVLGE